MPVIPSSAPSWVEAAQRTARMVLSFANRRVEPEFFRAAPATLEAKQMIASLSQRKATAVSLTDLYRFGLQPSEKQTLRNSQFMVWPSRFGSHSIQRGTSCAATDPAPQLAPITLHYHPAKLFHST